LMGLQRKVERLLPPLPTPPVPMPAPMPVLPAVPRQTTPWKGAAAPSAHTVQVAYLERRQQELLQRAPADEA